MTSFRKSINSVIAIIVVQILLLCTILLVNDRHHNANNVHLINKSDHFKPAINSPDELSPSVSAKINFFVNKIQIISQELWNYLAVYSQSLADRSESTTRMIDDMSDIKNIIQLEAQSLRRSLSVENWRQRESQELSEQISRHIDELQNPSADQCLSRRTIVCNHTNPYGFAAGIHDIIFCLIVGYYSNRTVVLVTKDYHYLKEGTEKWTDFLQPLSATCDERLFYNRSEPSLWPGSNNPVSRRLIRYLPKRLGKRIVGFHSQPMVWWLSQFAHYVMRPQISVEKALNETKLRLNFSHPIVGLHVRRTDKIGTEGGFHDVSEYMIHIEDHYRRRELLGNQSLRKVYLATDDPSVWDECRQKYPNYVFVGNQMATTMASNTSTRYSYSSAFFDVIIDILLLSQTDYLVCTMSSNVCRLAYELMQKHFTDGGLRGQSIDVPFHYAFAHNPSRVARYNHNPTDTDQWTLKVGDTLHARDGQDFMGQAINAKKFDSYLYGTDDKRTDYLRYPAYKTVQKFLLF